MQSPRRPRLDPALGALAVLAALACAWQAPVALRVVAGLLLALCLPGLELSRALFKGDLGPVRTAVLTLALSLAVDVLGGLILSVTPGGLTEPTWAALLGAAAALASIAAYLRRRNLPAPGAWTLPLPPNRTLGLGAVGGLLMAAGIAAAVVGGAPQPVAASAQLWALPGSGSSSGGVVGVHSVDRGPASFVVEVRVRSRLVHRYAFTLGGGKTWQHDLAVPRNRTEVLLYRGASGSPYRTAWLQS